MRRRRRPGPVSSRRLMPEASQNMRETEMEERHTTLSVPKNLLLHVFWNTEGSVSIVSCSSSNKIRFSIRGKFRENRTSKISYFICLFINHLVEDILEIRKKNKNKITKHLEPIRKIWPFVRWISVLCLSAGGQDLTHDTPCYTGLPNAFAFLVSLRFLELCIVFLAFDIFYLVFFVALACLFGIAVSCYSPSTVASSYAMPDQGGATDEAIRLLPRYKFRAPRGAREGPLGGVMTESGGGGAPTAEHHLSPDHAVCCVCRSAYEYGAVIRRLPCGHRFHGACIDEWLQMKAACPHRRNELARGSAGATTLCRGP
ncbi:unnamed protein product [Spirodela intermedia]|uniref:RING-type E3 ubiquitin transferase n=1 Tax=Spirodela intermedia TaxID=51605 RepID=A0A7I8LLC3_SPIIN|nr:unnamed protein product [Spirodela intermedia]